MGCGEKRVASGERLGFSFSLLATVARYFEWRVARSEKTLVSVSRDFEVGKGHSCQERVRNLF